MTVIDLSAKRTRWGDYAFVRYLRNQGVPLDLALFIMTGRRESRV